MVTENSLCSLKNTENNFILQKKVTKPSLLQKILMFSCHRLQESCMKYLISFALKDHQEDISAISYGDRKTGNLACHLNIVNM